MVSFIVWFKTGKGVRPGCTLSPCLFNFCAEYIIRNAGLDESEAGIRIFGRNINNLRHVDDTTLMAESEEELKSFLMNVEGESGKAGVKLNTEKKRRSWYPVLSREGGKMQAVTDSLCLSSRIPADGDCSHEIKGCLLLGRNTVTNLDHVLKGRDITLPANVCIVKAMVVPVVM